MLRVSQPQCCSTPGPSSRAWPPSRHNEEDCSVNTNANAPQVQKQNKMTIQVFEVFARALTYLVRWAGPLEVLLLFSTLLEVIAGWEMKWTTMSVHSTMNERACIVLPKGWRSQCSLQFGLTRGNLSNSRTSSFPSYKSYAVPSG